MKNSDPVTHDGVEKPVWHAPTLKDLGHLKDFIRTGNAFGKSGQRADGESMAGGETMQ